MQGCLGSDCFLQEVARGVGQAPQTERAGSRCALGDARCEMDVTVVAKRWASSVTAVPEAEVAGERSKRTGKGRAMGEDDDGREMFERRGGRALRGICGRVSRGN